MRTKTTPLTKKKKAHANRMPYYIFCVFAPHPRTKFSSLIFYADYYKKTVTPLKKLHPSNFFLFRLSVS